MKDTTFGARLQIFLQRYIIPHHPFSRLLGMLANGRWWWVKNTFIWVFSSLYTINMKEAEESNPYAYENFNAFFTRALKAGSRPIAQEKSAIASPADGIISEVGTIKTGTMLHAKSAALSVLDLLGGDAERAKPFEDGDFITIYLAPKDYHRVHLPVDGTLKEMVHIPGRLFSVSPLTVTHIPHLFTKNERIVALFDTATGPMAVVLVGAMIVASIATRWEGIITPPRHRQVRRWDYGDNGATIKRGEEIGHFQLGSTVLVLFPNNTASWKPGITANTPIKMGEALGRLLSS